MVQSGRAAPEGEEPTAETVTRTLRVQGITCPDCITTIAASVKRLPGARRVSGSVERGTVRVAFEPARTTLQDVVGAIEVAGYRVVQVES